MTKWASDSSLIYGLPSISYNHGTPEIWDDGILKFLSGNSNADTYGYTWNGITWNINNNIKSGIANKYNAEFAIFNDDGTWKCIQGDNYGNWFGYTWGGSAWSPDASVINGLTSAGSASQMYKPCIFDDSGTFKLIYGKKDGNFVGYYWNGSSWISDPSIVYGLPDIGWYSNPEIYDNCGVWNMIAGQGYAGPRGFYWTGSAWAEDTTVVNGLSTINAFGSFTVFQNTNLIAGRYANTFLGFSAPPSHTIQLGKQNTHGMSILGGTSSGKQNIPGLSIPSGISL